VIRMFQVAGMPNGCCHRLSSLDVIIGRAIPLSNGARANCGIDANNKRKKPIFTEIQFAHLISMTVCVCVFYQGATALVVQGLNIVEDS
jgi:hypothetical protein